MTFHCKRLFFTALLCAGAFYSHSQTNHAAALENFTAKNVFEKVYVHTDSDFYVTGEIIWLKVYGLNSTSNTPIDLSKVVYLELLSSNGTSTLKTKIEMEGGKGHGSIYLPVSVSTGNYILRAYTSWMKNFDSQFFFEKVISVVNTFATPKNLPDDGSGTPTIAFFPEGGHLVNGLPAKIAFKVEDEKSIRTGAVGALLSAEDTVAVFSTDTFGLGSFDFVPDINASYQVLLQYNDSLFYVDNFPKIERNGYALDVEEYASTFNVKVFTNFNSSNVLMVVHSGKTVNVVKKQKIEDGETIFNLDKALLDQGISYITIFDPNNEPVADRLVFKQPTKHQLKISTDKSEYGLREKAVININNHSEGNLYLSLSITLKDSLQSFTGTGIPLYTLLLSELKGHIKSPEYFIAESSGTEFQERINNLMLTQEWRKFEWDDILDPHEKSYDFLPEIEGHIIHGQITNEKNGSADPGVRGLLSVPGKVAQLYASKSSGNGNIRFVTNDFYGVKELVFQPFQVEGQIYKLSVVDPFIGDDPTVEIPHLQLNKKWEGALRRRSIYAQSQNLYFKDRNNAIDPKNYNDSIPFFGAPSKKYMLDDYTRFPTMEEVMREFVPEVTVRKRGEDFNYRMLNDRLSSYFEENPLVLLDGVPVLVNEIIKYDPLLIESLDVITGRYMLGHDIWVDGIASYISYKGNFGDFPLEPWQVNFNYEGLQLKREFYMPQYYNSKGDTRIPDFRSLLYWDPNITISEGNSMNLDFFTSDIIGRFQITLEGISEDGELFYETLEINVK